MTAKGTQLTKKFVFPSHFLHKSLYQPSNSPQTQGISVRFAVAEQIERCTTTHANAIHEGLQILAVGTCIPQPLAAPPFIGKSIR